MTSLATVGLVGSGAMGSALGAGWIVGGTPVRTCLVGRSERTQALSRAAGIEPVATLADVVRCDVVVSVVPPGEAVAAARNIVAAAAGAGTAPLVVDLNAISPPTLARIERELAVAGLGLVDGSISGGPPSATSPTRVYLSGELADDVLTLPNPWLDVVRLDSGLGAASALKMCTASMYKGSNALIMQAMLTAQQHGVLEQFLQDTARKWPDDVPRWHTDIALAATKSGRFVAEMNEIARTQRAAGLPVELFTGVAAVYARAATTPAGHRAPESAAASSSVDEVLAELAPAAPELPGAVLFDFSGTLFHIESAEQALLGALGPELLPMAPRLRHFGAINGSATPAELPTDLADVWDRRDLSMRDHHAAYSGLSVHAGLTREQADTLYRRGVSADSWRPFGDTVRVLRTLHERGVPIAMISNIGWDPRPVLARYGADRDIDVLVLSYERGVQKPDPEIFRLACADLGVDPRTALMVGDNPAADGAATAIGVRFALVPADPDERSPDALALAVGLPTTG